jgi:putative Flp pilus-assembly TadE/G-like protein
MMLQRWFRERAGHRSTAVPSPAAGPGRPGGLQRWRARGQALPLLAIMLVALIGFTGLALDVSMLLLRTLQQQRAADAAALAGVIKLPQQPVEAKTLAQYYAGLNGYVNNPDPTGFPQVDAQQVPGYNTRLHVIIVAKHPVYFMRIFGFSDVTITRDAYAQYSLPVRMGCPNCTSFGVGNPTPVTMVGNGPGKCPNCLVENQKFWLAVDGPGTDNKNGDFYNTKFLNSQDNVTCINPQLNTGTINPSYVRGPGPNAGYSYGVHVDASQGNIALYVWDPAQYYRTGIGPGSTDGDTGDTQFCAAFYPSRFRFRTYFQLYEPDNTPDLFTDDVPMGPPVSFEDDGTPAVHNKWFLVGTLPASLAANGDFRLQVYTNDVNGSGTYGVGQNAYSLALGGPREPNNVETIYGISKLSLYNNIRQITGSDISWYLAQITREHAGEKMSVMMYDPGDAACNTNMQVFRESDPVNPIDFNLNWTGVHDTTLLTTNMQNPPGPGRTPYNGTWVTLGIKLPENYTDDYWRVKYTMAGCGATSTDRTVWQIVMLGNPIHLVNQGP